MAQARAEEVGPEEGSGGDEEGASSVAADYVTIYKMMSPSFDGPPLSREQLCRLLPLATGMQFFWVLLFMIVELSGGAGGTSGVAGTRTVTLFVVYIILIVIALLIARASAAGSLKNSALVLMYTLVASITLAAMLGSSMSTFGVEVCNGSATLGPVASNASVTAEGIRPLLPQRSQCGIDSPGRGAKIVFEFFFSLFFGLAPLVASFTVVISADGIAMDTQEGQTAPSMTANYVLAPGPTTSSGDNEATSMILQEPHKRDMVNAHPQAVQHSQEDAPKPLWKELQEQSQEREKQEQERRVQDSNAFGAAKQLEVEKHAERSRQLQEQLELVDRQENQLALQRQQLELQKQEQERAGQLEQEKQGKQRALQQQELNFQKEQQQREREIEEELVRTREVQLQQQLAMQRQQQHETVRAEPPPSLNALAAPPPRVVRVGTIVSTQNSIEKLPPSARTYEGSKETEGEGGFRPAQTRPSIANAQRSPSPTGSTTSIASNGSRLNGSQVRSEARAVRDRAKAALAASASSSVTAPANTQQIYTAPKPRAPSEDYFSPAPAVLSGAVSGGEGDHIPDEDVDDIINQYLE